MPRQKRDKRIKDLFAYAEDNRPSLVYMATNRINRKRYIGLTRLTLEKRRATHIKNAIRTHGHHTQYFYNAMRKHGADAFDFVELRKCVSYKEACAVERELIAELRPEYNITAGGEGILGHRHNAETRRKMSAAKKGRGPWAKGQCPQAVRDKLSAHARTRTGVRNAKHLAALRVNAQKMVNARRRAVWCPDDGIAFPSATHAANHYGVTNATVLSQCGGRYATSRTGVRLVFVEDWFREEMT